MKNFLDQKFKFLSNLALLSLIFCLGVNGLSTLIDLKKGLKTENQQNNTMVFSGVGEVVIKPDVASFVITIRESAPSVAQAQQKMAEKAQKLFYVLEAKGADKADIQTENYTTNPLYSYEGVICKKSGCSSPKRVLKGYEAFETVSVKFRNIEKVGEILGKIAELSISEVRGPIFAIEDPQKFRSDAQLIAIKKAKADAQVSAKNLGVKLGKIIGFSEDAPYQGHNSRAVMSAKSAAVDSLESVRIESGSDKISVRVFVTYQID